MIYNTYSYNGLIAAPGDSLRFKGLPDHVATVARCGGLYSHSLGKRLSIVSFNNIFCTGEVVNEGLIGPNERELVLDIYEKILGTEYNPFTLNCEHLNNLAHGLGMKSETIKAILGFGMVCGVGLTAYSMVRRAA